jgi:hypothetical protein
LLVIVLPCPVLLDGNCNAGEGEHSFESKFRFFRKAVFLSAIEDGL